MDYVIKINGNYVGWETSDTSLLGLGISKWCGYSFASEKQAKDFVQVLKNNVIKFSSAELEDEYTEELIEAFKDFDNAEIEIEER